MHEIAENIFCVLPRASGVELLCVGVRCSGERNETGFSDAVSGHFSSNHRVWPWDQKPGALVDLSSLQFVLGAQRSFKALTPTLGQEKCQSNSQWVVLGREEDLAEGDPFAGRLDVQIPNTVERRCGGVSWVPRELLPGTTRLSTFCSSQRIPTCSGGKLQAFSRDRPTKAVVSGSGKTANVGDKSAGGAGQRSHTHSCFSDFQSHSVPPSGYIATSGQRASRLFRTKHLPQTLGTPDTERIF